MLSRQARAILGLQCKDFRTAVHLRCTVEQAARIREYAARRQLSISDFVAFSRQRLWRAIAQLRGG
jgi:hypothetical protein